MQEVSRTTIYVGDAFQIAETLAPESVDCILTSPPYWKQRRYGESDMEFGREPDVRQYVARLVGLFSSLRSVLRPRGTLWLVIADSFMSSSKMTGATRGIRKKELCGVPWRVALAMQDDGWFLRQDVIWSKPNPLPESVTDRCTRSHEYVFMFSRERRYWYDAKAIAEPAMVGDHQRRVDNAPYAPGGQHPHHGLHRRGSGNVVRKLAGEGFVESHLGRSIPWQAAELRNCRSVWSFSPEPVPGHNATFPSALARRCILASVPPGGVVLDPFLGSGTTATVANALGRDCIGLELNERYVRLARRRIGLLARVEVVSGHHDEEPRCATA